MRILWDQHCLEKQNFLSGIDYDFKKYAHLKLMSYVSLLIAAGLVDTEVLVKGYI